MEGSSAWGRLLDTQDFDNHALAALAVELGVEHALPGAEVKLAAVTGRVVSWWSRRDFRCASPLSSPVW